MTDFGSGRRAQSGRRSPLPEREVLDDGILTIATAWRPLESEG
jgi:hypothetical protein